MFRRMVLGLCASLAFIGTVAGREAPRSGPPNGMPGVPIFQDARFRDPNVMFVIRTQEYGSLVTARVRDFFEAYQRDKKAVRVVRNRNRGPAYAEEDSWTPITCAGTARYTGAVTLTMTVKFTQPGYADIQEATESYDEPRVVNPVRRYQEFQLVGFLSGTVMREEY